MCQSPLTPNISRHTLLLFHISCSVDSQTGANSHCRQNSARLAAVSLVAEPSRRQQAVWVHSLRRRGPLISKSAKGRMRIMETSRDTTMCATVCQVQRCCLCVCDHCTNQEVLVHYNCSCCFHVGDRVCIHYNGVMTGSIPPQITADCIERISC